MRENVVCRWNVSCMHKFTDKMLQFFFFYSWVRSQINVRRFYDMKSNSFTFGSCSIFLIITEAKFIDAIYLFWDDIKGWKLEWIFLHSFKAITKYLYLHNFQAKNYFFHPLTKTLRYQFQELEKDAISKEIEIYIESSFGWVNKRLSPFVTRSTSRNWEKKK